MRHLTIGVFACALAAGSVACPPWPEDPLSGAEHDARARRAWAAGPAQVDPRWISIWHEHAGNDGGLAGVDPAIGGAWEAPMEWPLIAIHAALLPDGRVLHYSYPDASPGSRARLWDPASGRFSIVDVEDDLFCSGISQLGDGTLLVTGGNATECEFQGTKTTYLFDGDDEETPWEQLGDMAVGRWYPTNITLADGTALVVSGLDHTCAWTNKMEHFVPGAGMSIVPSGQGQLQLYPRLHLLSDGRIAHVAPEIVAKTFKLGQGGWQTVDSQESACRRYAGGAVSVPGEPDRLIVFGGSCSSTVYANAESIDFAAAQPQWTPIAPMHFARHHLNPVILPDGTVLVVGGGSGAGLYQNPVLAPELYDPAIDAWTLLPPQVYGRMYHSTALLLPDARVLVAGQDSGPSSYFAEIYRPAYLFRGPRPEFVATPLSIVYGQPFQLAVELPEGAALDRLAFVRLGTTTHSVNFDQRLLWLDFAPGGAPEAGTGFVAIAPALATVAPPGYYMLFALSDAGVPSHARIVRIGPGAFGDLDGDGQVGGADLGLLLAAWGDAPSIADLDGDDDVDGSDLGLLLAAWG